MKVQDNSIKLNAAKSVTPEITGMNETIDKSILLRVNHLPYNVENPQNFSGYTLTKNLLEILKKIHPVVF